MKKRLFSIWSILLVLVISLAVLVPGCEGEGEGEGETPYVHVDFYQLDLNLDGDNITDSSWGVAMISCDSYDPYENVMYLNLAVQDSWVVQNIPLMPVTTEFTVDFDLEVGNGTDVTELQYACEITPEEELTTMPTSFQGATVAAKSAVIYSGEMGVTGTFGLPGCLIGGLFVDGAWHSSDVIVNQACNKTECVPAAVSNSLRYLNATHGLNMSEDQMKIETMKTATGWIPGEGCPGGWWNTKNEYMVTNGYPIETTTYGAGDLDEVIEAIENGYDVEVGADSHRAMLVGILKLANGKYVMAIAHDTAQGEDGGEEIQITVYDPDTGIFTGGKWFDGSGLINFVVESPAPD